MTCLSFCPYLYAYMPTCICLWYLYIDLQNFESNSLLCLAIADDAEVWSRRENISESSNGSSLFWQPWQVPILNFHCLVIVLYGTYSSCVTWCIVCYSLGAHFPEFKTSTLEKASKYVGKLVVIIYVIQTRFDKRILVWHVCSYMMYLLPFLKFVMIEWNQLLKFETLVDIWFNKSSIFR